jgi:hypothetical protein
MVHVELLSIDEEASRGRDPTLGGCWLSLCLPNHMVSFHFFELRWATSCALPDPAMHVPGSFWLFVLTVAVT